MPIKQYKIDKKKLLSLLGNIALDILDDRVIFKL